MTTTFEDVLNDIAQVRGKTRALSIILKTTVYVRNGAPLSIMELVQEADAVAATLADKLAEARLHELEGVARRLANFTATDTAVIVREVLDRVWLELNGLEQEQMTAHSSGLLRRALAVVEQERRQWQE